LNHQIFQLFVSDDQSGVGFVDVECGCPDADASDSGFGLLVAYQNVNDMIFVRISF